MPIDLAEYTLGMKAALKKSGFCCVYVAAAGDGRPCRVGYALDLPAAIQRLQRASPVPIAVHDAMWVPDRGMATMIAQSVQATINAHRGNGGWFDLAAESVAGEVNLATDRLYPGASTIPHQKLVSRWMK